MVTSMGGSWGPRAATDITTSDFFFLSGNFKMLLPIFPLLSSPLPPTDLHILKHRQTFSPFLRNWWGNFFRTLPVADGSQVPLFFRCQGTHN